MGFADYAWRHPASFKRRKSGELGSITFEGIRSGLTAFDPNGEQLFSLAYDPASGYKMLDTGGHPALLTKAGHARDTARVEDKNGRHLTTLDKQSFAWDGSSYDWQPQASLALNGATTYELKEVEAGCKKDVLATLRLPGGLETASAELNVHLGAEGIPLGLLIFQAMMIEHQWSRLKMLAPLKRLSFSSKWI